MKKLFKIICYFGWHKWKMISLQNRLAPYEFDPFCLFQCENCKIIRFVNGEKDMKMVLNKKWIKV